MKPIPRKWFTASKPRSSPGSSVIDPGDKIGFSAENFDAQYFMGVPPYVVAAERQMDGGWNPNKQSTLFARNRALLETESNFVQAWHRVRSTMFNQGFRFAGAAEPLQTWADKLGVSALMRQLNNDVWGEWLLNDNAIVFWIEPQNRGELPQPIVLDTELCEYSCTVGSETLKVKLPKRKLSAAEKQKMSKRWSEAYEKGLTLTLDPDAGECFKVLKRAKAGKNLANPRLGPGAYRILKTLGLLHVSDCNGAWQSRDVIQRVTVGRDMKFSEAIRYPQFFTMSAKEKKHIDEQMKTKRGAFRMTTDIKVALSWDSMDPKFFTSEKYQGTMDQLNLWGGAGMMLLATGHQWLVPFFAAEGLADRADVGAFLNTLMTDPAFLKVKPPKFKPKVLPPKPEPPKSAKALPAPPPPQPPSSELRAGWNPNTFKDAALVLQEMQFAAGQGAMSIQTSRENLGLDNQIEGDRLGEEKADPDRYQPGFEPKQGMLSGPNGRPADPKPGQGGA